VSSPPPFRIAAVAAGDLAELLPLMRGYCDFYEVAPRDEQLRTLAQTLLDAPETAGLQLIARDGDGTALGFATIYWSFSTLAAAPIGVMNDLYVDAASRLRGVGRALIEACAAECAAREVPLLEWETAPDNHRAQGLYDRLDARRETWLAYTLAVGRARAASD
jgi:ribosomal protein S18 acetylase RimI-like enzyme